MLISVLLLLDSENEFTRAVGAYTDPEKLAAAVAVLNQTVDVRENDYGVGINEITIDMPLDLADFDPEDDEDEDGDGDDEDEDGDD